MMRRRRQLSEQGSALVIAIIMAVLAAIVMIAVQTMLDMSGKRTQARSDRAGAVSMVDRALASYEFALESGLTAEYQGYRLDATMLNRIATSSMATGMAGRPEAVANSTFPSRFPGLATANLHRTWMDAGTGGAAQWAVSMRTPLRADMDGWWQLYNVVNSKGTLIVYVRTWTASPNGRLIAEPRVVRAEMRPGRFSDYQILVDGPLKIGDTVDVKGRIHTNGYPDAYLVDGFVDPARPLNLDNPRCFPGAGFSTASGGSEGTCRMQGGWATFPSILKTNNGRRINLLRGRDTLAAISTTQMCSTQVLCMPGPQPFRITLSGASARVTNGAGATRSIDTRTRHAIVVSGNATLTGTMSTGSLTIGVQNSASGGASAFGSSSLRLLGSGDIGATGASSVLGLVVEGDVVPAIDAGGNCVRSLHAAIVSPSGTLTMPAQYRVPALPSGTPTFCRNTFKLNGSISAHYSPLLYLAWRRQSDGAIVEAGFNRRVYDYDERLRSNPPPLFPTTGPWQVISWKNAVTECLGARHADPNCG